MRQVLEDEKILVKAKKGKLAQVAKPVKATRLAAQIRLMGLIVGVCPILAMGLLLWLLAPKTLNDLVVVGGWAVLVVLGSLLGWLWSHQINRKLRTGVQILAQGSKELDIDSSTYLFPTLYDEAEFAAVYAGLNAVINEYRESISKLTQQLNESRQLYNYVNEQVKLLKNLNQVAQAINSTLDISTLYQVTQELLHQHVNFDWLAIATRTIQGDELKLAQVEPYALVTAYQENLAVSNDSLLYKVFEQRHTLYQPFLWRGDQLDPEADKSVAEAGLRSLIMLPIYYDNQSLGVLSLASYQPDAFSNAQIELIAATTLQLGMALNNARIYAELQAAYDDLKSAQVAMKQAARQSALGEMAAGVAHDFNNILTAILGNSELLTIILQSPEEAEMARSITKAASDAAQMIKRIADFGRRRNYIEYVQLSVNDIVKDAIEFTRPRIKSQAEMHGVVIQVETDLSATEKVYGNSHELREALTNFIVNAIDAMPKGGTLKLTTSNDDRVVSICVSDSGTGIPPETLSHIFEAFYTTKGERGTGLGLAVTNNIISQHHGQLNVESQLNVGTTFTINLPTAKISAEIFNNEAAALSVILPETTPSPASVELHILVADDDVGARVALGRSLRNAGYIVEEAQNGAEAWTLLQQHRYDLIIADMGMPVMSGIELIEEMRRNKVNLPVIVVTGWNYAPNQNRLRSLQVDTVIAKPYRYQELIELIGRTLAVTAPSA